MMQKAYDERKAIKNCDVLVYLWEQDQESARYEAGMAMGLAKPLVIAGGHQSHFFSLPNVHMVQSDNDIMQALSQIELRGNLTGSEYE
jgi:hypothetical protein